MRTPPLLLALQGPEIDTRGEEDPEATVTTESTENMKLQPNNKPVIPGKQDSQGMHLNVTNSQIFKSIPVPDDNDEIEFDSGMISTFEPITADETIGTTEYSTDHTMKMNDIDYETPSFVESPDSTSDYLEPETNTLPTTTDNLETEWSGIIKTVINSFKDESLTTVTSVEFEFPTERTFVTMDDAEMHETSTIAEASETESSTSTDLYINTETPILSNILNFPHEETPKNKTAVIPDMVTDKNIFLEASPTTGVSDVTDLPLTDASKFDFKIVTTRKGLQVDAHDTVFDPTQIAKATSYEGSSYSTATRSATVTTWLDPNDRNIIMLKHSNSSSSDVSKSSTLILHSGMEDNISIAPTHTLSNISEEPLQLKDSGDKMIQDGQEVTTAAQGENVDMEGTTNAAEIATNYDADTDDQNVLEDRDFKGKKGVSVHENEMKINGDRLFNNTSSDTRIPTGKLLNLSSINVRNEINSLYELPEANINNSSDLYFSTSVIVALSVCCSIALLAGLMTLTLWLCRRHRSRSKIYLSREAAKPRAFFTKPMNPALLPDESFEEPKYVLEFQQPRAPIMLGSDHEDAVFKPKNSDDFCIGLENDGFTDIPLEELKVEGYKKNKRPSQDPPKYGSKSKIESDNDSGIRVWSSTGSLYTASPQLTHCSVPPPPYSPSIGEEPACLSVHSLPSLSKKLGSLDI